MRVNQKKSLPFIFLSLIFIVSVGVYSQRPYKSVNNPINNIQNKAVTDTLFPTSFLYGTLTLDSALAGGYVCGTNAYGDVAKAQIYIIEDSLSYFVNGCALYVGDILISDSSKNLTVNVYDLTGMGYNTDSLIYNNVPGNIIGTVDVPITLLIENQLNYIYFSNEIWVNDGYAIGMDFTNFGTNQIGLISTSNGDAQERELAWEKLSNWQWYSMLSTWPFDGDMGIFSLINSVNAGINSDIKQDLNSICIFPNPTQSNTFNINCQSTTETKACINIYDICGSLVYEKNVLYRMGENTVSINMPDVKSGNYFISVKTLNNNFIKKITLL